MSVSNKEVPAMVSSRLMKFQHLHSRSHGPFASKIHVS